MEILNSLEIKSKEKVDIREQIWGLLKSKGFEKSSHSNKILKKQIEVRNPDSQSEYPTRTVTLKYRFGANNLQKFTGDFKNYSIPFCRLTVVDGKITKKKE